MSPISGDAAIAVFVVAVVAMVIVPLPTMLLDVLIAVNVALSLGLLVVALYVSEPSQLAALPSMLLLATLFRLGLNISTTRLVLLNGDAGRIVEAFGRIVVGGNIVVGAAVFLVMALVQFIVIAKGSERVAEVAARFTLDALPGKQMSIDADLRAGSLTLEAAQERRRSLERESQLYGALDGAMKFVKGDAVAGLVIVAINIVGGLAIGVLQRGMSFGSAAAHYTVLTVGDGLAAQLPSLLVSTTAGLVVTRVPGDRADGNLGGDVASQMGRQPRALAITASLLVVLAMVPGLPAAPFVALAAIAGVAAAARYRHAPRSGAGRGALPTAPDPLLVLANRTPIRVALGPSAFRCIERDAAERLTRRVPVLRLRIAARLGVRIPEIAVDEDDSLGPDDYQIVADSVVVGRGALPHEPAWVAAVSDELKPFGINAIDRPAPAGRGRLAWCDAPGAERARGAGYETGDRAALVIRHVETAVTAVAAEFVGVQEARDLTDALETTHPALVAELVPRLVPLARLADVLRRLVAERVSISDVRAIFEALAAVAHHDADPGELTEAVRAQLGRQITQSLTAGRETLAVYVLSPEVEQEFRDNLRYTPPGGTCAVDHRTAERIMRTLAELEAMPHDPAAPRPVLLVAADVRRHVRALVAFEFPELATISPVELASGLTVQRLAIVE